MTKALQELLLEGVQTVAGVSPSAFLQVGYSALVKVMQFIEQNPEAEYADRKLRTLFADSNWVLDAQALQDFFQLMGEVQFWMVAKERKLLLDRIPEGNGKAADFQLKGASPLMVQFEVKTLSVSGGWRALAQMAEDSYRAQIDLSVLISAWK